MTFLARPSHPNQSKPKFREVQAGKWLQITLGFTRVLKNHQVGVLAQAFYKQIGLFKFY